MGGDKSRERTWEGRAVDGRVLKQREDMGG